MKLQFSEDIWEKISALWKVPLEKSDSLQYSDPQVRKLIKLMFRFRQAFKFGCQSEFDVQKAWERVNERTEGPTCRKMNRRIMKYAAVVILLVGITIFITRHQSFEPVKVVGFTPDSIVSGTHKAELILANGEQILLSDYTGIKEIDEMGVKLVSDTLTGKLQYEVSGKGDSLLDEFNVLKVPKGGEYALILPDGSQVWLNSETTLRFPVRFGRHKREVFLEGEAYFKVQHNPDLPFHVLTDGKDITVLGTSFNVSAYPDDKQWATTLVNGKVCITVGEKQILMKPSEQYLVERTTGIGHLKKVDTEWYSSWVDGKFYFKAFTFEEIVKKLERWYDFTMIYQNEEIRRMRFSGTINKHRPLAEILNYLEKTTHIRFHITGKIITVEMVNN